VAMARNIGHAGVALTRTFQAMGRTSAPRKCVCVASSGEVLLRLCPRTNRACRDWHGSARRGGAGPRHRARARASRSRTAVPASVSCAACRISISICFLPSSRSSSRIRWWGFPQRTHRDDIFVRRDRRGGPRLRSGASIAAPRWAGCPGRATPPRRSCRPSAAAGRRPAWDRIALDGGIVVPGPTHPPRIYSIRTYRRK
jgi:hypothetical protein